MRFYTVDQLSPNRHLTPEGFLLCKDVAIGRTGDMHYAPGEVPVRPGPDGIIRITRDADAVFHDDTIASFQGKPVTMDHPMGDVNPANWGMLAKGIVQHARRGVGASENLLLADLLITDQAAIQAVVRDGLRQVSCGYDAVYEEIEPGHGRQRNIIGNHVALVEQGRCGERCAIGDKQTMPNTQQTTWKDKLRNIFHANDAVSFETLLKDMPENAAPKTATADGALTLDAVSGLFTKFEAKFEDRFAGIEKKLKSKVRDEDPDDDEDDEEEKERKRKKKEEEEEEEDEEKKRKKSEDRKTADAARTRDEMHDVIARAEILSPGIQLPTFDSAQPAKVRDSLCALRRKALTRFADSERGREVVQPLLGGKTADFSAMTCDAVATVFVGASEIAKRENNMAATMSHDSIKRAKDTASTIAEINRRNREIYEIRK